MGLTFYVLIGPASIGLLSPGILEYLLQSLVSVLDSFLSIHIQQLSLIIIIIEKSLVNTGNICCRKLRFQRVCGTSILGGNEKPVEQGTEQPDLHHPGLHRMNQQSFGSLVQP